MTYDEFLLTKELTVQTAGCEPTYLPDFLMPFQRHLVEWGVRLGRAAFFADCGLGKGAMAMTWGVNAAEQTKKPTLIVAPLAVSRQFLREADKFGFDLNLTQNGKLVAGLNVTNYERMHNFDPDRIGALAIDESSILKGFDRKYRRELTAFMKQVRFRSLWSATPAPNDYMEFGSSCEALGVMGRNQMLGMFFTNGGESTQQWRLKGHARTRFWRWMASWSRAVRKPSDIGFEDDGFILPPLNLHKHVLPSDGFRKGVRRTMLPQEATTMEEQREENRRTVEARCKQAAELVPKDRQCIVWCHRNDESEMLSKLIKGAVEVKGSDTDQHKEDSLIGFSTGDVRVLVTKPKIAGHGMNWQCCSDVIYFPSHSHEQFYQAIRRCWRFGQTKPVNVHLITSRANLPVMENMLRKERLSDEMYESVVRHMAKAMEPMKYQTDNRMELPPWMR